MSERKSYSQISQDGSSVPSPWKLEVVVSEECLSYMAFHTQTQEAVLIDIKREDWDLWMKILPSYPGARVVGVVDTHTHADHVSHSSKMAAHLGVPLIQSAHSKSKRIDLRVSRNSALNLAAGPLRLMPVLGHTADSLCVQWGPFFFTGDHVLYGDVGRDDLPTGSAEAHHDSLMELKGIAKPEWLVLPGHDSKGGRACTWGTQLKINSSLTQARADYVAECAAFKAPFPKNFEESIAENLK